MLRIRLARIGMKGKPSYRIVVVSSQRKRQGKSVDSIGYWYPSKRTKKIDREKLKFWISTGAKPSCSLRKLLMK